MATYVNSAVTFEDLQNMVLQELKEALPGTEAVPLDLVKDKLNLVYMEAFNDQRMNQTAREGNASFQVANDATLVGDYDAGDDEIELSSAVTFQSSGMVLLQDELIPYSAKVGNILTLPVTGLDVKHYDGEVARQVYTLSLIAPNIDTEQVHYVDVNGIPYTYMHYDQLFNNINFFPNCYTIYQGHLLLSRQATQGSDDPLSAALITYSTTVVPMEETTDEPSLIPNSFRASVLVNGACYKIGASDDFRTSTDYWKNEYELALAKYIAFKNTRVRDINNKKRPTVWSRFNTWV